MRKTPLVVALAAALALAGCGGPDAAPTAASTPTIAPTPSASSVSQKPTSALQSGPDSSIDALDKYTLGELQSMPSGQFNELTFESKAKYIKYLLEDSKKHLIYYAAPGTKLYEHNPLDVASATNTPQEIAMQLWYELQVASAQPVSDNVDDHTLDTEKAKKALSTAFYSTTGPNAPPTYLFLKDRIDEGKEAGRLQDRYTDAKELTPLAEKIDDNGYTIQVKTISLLDSGVEHVLEVTPRELDDDTSIWQIYKQLK